MTPPDRPAAVLWDMDGTLIDSEPTWIRCQRSLAHEHGATWTETDGLDLVGADLPRTAAALQRAGVGLAAEAIVERLENDVLEALRQEITWRPGALALLGEMKTAGWLTAIVTTSSSAMAAAVVAAAPRKSFDTVVAAESSPAPKPAPDPYLQAAQLLRVPIAACIAIEDSSTGLASAIAAGAVCIAVASQAPLRTPPRGAIWSTLADRTLDDLAALLRSC